MQPLFVVVNEDADLIVRSRSSHVTITRASHFHYPVHLSQIMLRRPSLWVVWSNLWWFLLLWTTRTLVVGQQNEDGGKSITEIVETKPNLVLFRELWEHTSLAFTLNDPTARYTLFAPDNSGFTTEFLYEDFLRGTQWRGHLLHFLQHHLIPHQELAQVDLGGPSTTTLTTAANEPLTVSFSRVGNNQSILEPNLMASNGMVHVVQGPLLSPSLQQTLLETLLNRKDTYSIFAELVSRAGLERLLRGAGGTPLTILAPPNTAFDDLGPPFLATLRNPDNVHYLRVLLLHHILPTNIYQWPTTGTTLTSLVPTTLFCSQDPHTGLVRINDAIVSHNTNSSLYTRNGMLYPVRRVLIPPSVVSMVQNVHLLTSLGYPRVLSLTTFSQWLALTGFDRDLHVASHLNQPNPVTVLAPLDQNNNDDDMSVLLTKWEQPDWLHHLRALVRYHMVAGIYPTLDKETSLRNLYGQNLTVSHVTNHQDDGSPQTIELSTGAAGGLSSLSSTTTRLVQPTNPLLVYNATIHVVDRVLVPPQLQMTILQQLRRVPQFSKLVEWLQQTGLDRDLENGVGPMTLFAPLNQAFDNTNDDSSITTPIATNNQSETPLWRGRSDPSSLSSSSPLDGYTLTEKRNLLLHHWLPTNVFTYELQDSTQLETRLLGQTVTVLQMEDQIEIQGSLLDETNANRMASNGVIHPVSDLWWPPPPVASSTDPLPPPPDDTLLLPPHHEDGVNEQAEGSDSIQVRFPNQEDNNNNNNNKEDKPTTTTTTTRSNSAGNNIASKPGILAAVVCGVWAAWLL